MSEPTKREFICQTCWTTDDVRMFPKLGDIERAIQDAIFLCPTCADKRIRMHDGLVALLDRARAHAEHLDDCDSRFCNPCDCTLGALLEDIEAALSEPVPTETTR